MAAEPEQRSRAAGGCVLAVLAGVALAAVWAASPEAAILAVWVVGGAAVWWSARHRRLVNDAANPAPPAPSSPSEAEFAQVIAEARREGAGVTEFPSGAVVISTPDAANPNLTHVRVIERPE